MLELKNTSSTEWYILIMVDKALCAHEVCLSAAKLITGALLIA